MNSHRKQEIADRPYHRFGTIRKIDGVTESIVSGETVIRLHDGTKTKYELSFSSEEPYERWFGTEILSHGKDAVNLERLASGNANLLHNHNTDQVIGVIESAEVKDGKGFATVRFGHSQLAKEIQKDVDDGIRSNISVGYTVDKYEVEEGKKQDTYNVIRWSPLEVSVVGVPADSSVGIGRCNENKPSDYEPFKKEIKMSKEIEKPSVQVVDKTEIRNKAFNEASEILAAGKTFKMQEEAASAVQRGISLSDFQKEIQTSFDKKSNEEVVTVEARDYSKAEKRDISGYSFAKAIRESGANHLTGLEAELHIEGSKNCRNSGIQPRGTIVPNIVLEQRATLDDGTGGGNLVIEDNLQAQSFIELLREKLVLEQMGARMLTGVVGTITFPRQATAITAENVANTAALTEATSGTFTLDVVTMSPKRIGGYQVFGKDLAAQTSIATENLIRDDLAKVIAGRLQRDCLYGTGAADDIEGIANILGSGSGDISLESEAQIEAESGGALTYSQLTQLENLVAAANAETGALAWLTGAGGRKRLRDAVYGGTSSARYLWEKTPGMGQAEVIGYPAYMTNTITGTSSVNGAFDCITTGGTDTQLFYGNWNDLMIAQYGGLDLVVDPYKQKELALIEVVAHIYVDANIRNNGSFAYIYDATP